MGIRRAVAAARDLTRRDARFSGRPPRVLVAGAGWSGLASAIELQRGGADVRVVDAAPHPGGRARRVVVRLGDRAFALDNGQHLLLGAYRSTRALMREVGLAPEQALFESPFELQYPDGFRIAAGRAPAPWHLLQALVGARGLSAAERTAIVAWVARRRCAGWRVEPDAPASTLFREHPARCVERLWDPLCLAALNVPLDQASARTLLNVLRDSLGATSAASRYLIARRDLSATFPDAAQAHLAQRGVAFHWRQPIRRLEHDASGGWRVQTRDAEFPADAIVLALPADRAASLLESAAQAPLDAVVAALRRVRHAPIATVYLRTSSAFRLPRPLLALRSRPGERRYGQFVFDRGWLDPACSGVLAVVVSGSGPHEQLDAGDLAAAASAQLASDLQLPLPIDHAVLREKHATIVPSPGLVRPATRLPLPGLYLASDAADSPYPSTLEGSVRSGIAAARAALQDFG